jgi:subtilisin family serine protease
VRHLSSADGQQFATGLVWGCVTLREGARRVVLPTLLVLLAVLLAVWTPGGTTRSDATGSQVSVIVRETEGAGDRPEQLVRALHGRVDRHLGIIDGFVATVPRDQLERLQASEGVVTVNVNRRVQLLGLLDGWDPTHDLGSMYYVAQEVAGAGEMWNDGWTGKGVDVALIDSGVAPVEGLLTGGKVVNGPDLSFESQNANFRYLDTFGHGTHMAGIIAGRDRSTPGIVQKGEESFVGMAPDARIVSVKVADAFGTTDVSQIIAAIDWVVQHRRDNGLNIRVLNLSFGTDGEQDYRVDPLTYAAEVAWRHGIVVVVAGGNGGFGSRKLNNPAYDPFVIAVGGADGNGTYAWYDDIVPAWSSYGDGTRNPDLVAPGKSIVSLRVPGSSLDLANPAARVGTSRFFRGSGTSQAAAVVSGAAALLIQQRPSITPDQVKALLKASAHELVNADPRGQGEGMLNLKLARTMRTPSSTQTWPSSAGTGWLDLSRGSSRLTWGGKVLAGEKDIFGAPFNSRRWAKDSLAGTAWSGGVWNGNVWSGNVWTTGSWTGNAWSSARWTANAWSGNAWSGNVWSGNVWSGNAWSGNVWSANAWSANAWSGNVWSSSDWVTRTR